MKDDFPRHPVEPGVVEEGLGRVIYQDDRWTLRVREVISALVEAGRRVYVVGGTPRDWLCGLPAKDIDLSLDAPVEEAHRVLRQAFPGIDPVLFHNARFGVLRWGDARSGGIDLNILRSPEDIQNDDMWTTPFVSRDDLRQDALTRDFSVNAFYYACHGGGALMDPLGCGLEDLRSRTLRLICHPRILDAGYRLSFRIIQFLGRGYAPAPNVEEYLRRCVDRDIQGMGKRLEMWVPNHLGPRSDRWEEFRRRLDGWIRQEASRKVLDEVFSALERAGR
ncbi:CCA tRNA nucleotidyltransferase [Archangium violaceum]|uniref:CCA tRNA nucleotidyltransferase n=1 Tax=Archangium violaceum TaxID=83451 RepID=UPI002B29DB00|nr:CCA tRNA nucleotidyltransferase [Archangium violaceum]